MNIEDADLHNFKNISVANEHNLNKKIMQILIMPGQVQFSIYQKLPRKNNKNDLW